MAAKQDSDSGGYEEDVEDLVRKWKIPQWEAQRLLENQRYD